MAATENEELVTMALRMALARRNPHSDCFARLHHRDRGSESSSQGYQACLAEEGIRVSQSRTGNAWDNAAMESFFATLKKECIYRHSFQTRRQARQAVFEYVECFYHPIRLHSTLDDTSPVAFEQTGNQSKS